MGNRFVSKTHFVHFMSDQNLLSILAESPSYILKSRTEEEMNGELLSFPIEIAIQTSHIEVVYIYNTFHHGLFLASMSRKSFTETQVRRLWLCF